MLKSLALSALLTTVSIASAQSSAAPDTQTPAPTQQAAPIVRSYQDPGFQQSAPQPPARRQPPQQAQIIDSQPVSGIWLRSDSTSVLSTVSATPQRTEVRLDRGRLNVHIDQPAQNSEILIDLPGGQTSLLKDGLYTFNADTGVVRVLRGEAAVYPGAVSASADGGAIDIADIKPVWINEDHQLSLEPTPAAQAAQRSSGQIKPVESYPNELDADLLPLGHAGDRAYANESDSGGDGPAYAPFAPVYAGAFGYPGLYPGYLGYGYPFGFGYGLGLGFGFGGYGGYGFGGYGYRGYGGYGGYRGGYGGGGGGRGGFAGGARGGGGRR